MNDAGAITRAGNSRLKRVLWVSFFAASVVVAAGIGVVAGHFAATRDDDVISMKSTPSVVLAVRDLARIEGSEYHIERVISLEEKEKRFFGLLEAKDAILLVASGEVIAGVDLSALDEKAFDVDAKRKAVHITLPSSTILSARLDSDHTYVYERKTDLLAERKESLETAARKQAESTLRDAAKEGGILKRSDESVRRTIESLARSLGYSEVQISFRAP